MPDTTQPPSRFAILRVPLFRLLAINLAAGAAVAVLLVGGLLLLNPGGIRDLILADRAPGVAIFLLLGSFLITFGSAAMGTAIMTVGGRPDDDSPRGGRRLRLARLKVRRKHG
ncbi:MAG: hypothetical protein HY852_12895 [Bradyrhizobium sp.]|uniref:hypothetical protein n=1 Tax=Bradyrhizobium sp. TaxID=376 RepID=UPI0025C68514|nr:hypothetical protein [Bradyrhizobium sp.]MBI5262701.1 hypothetical protein [Bradyrhizobium sp.]